MKCRCDILFSTGKQRQYINREIFQARIFNILHASQMPAERYILVLDSSCWIALSCLNCSSESWYKISFYYRRECQKIKFIPLIAFPQGSESAGRILLLQQNTGVPLAMFGSLTRDLADIKI